MNKRIGSATQRRLASLLATLKSECRQQSGLDHRLVPPDIDAAYQVAALVAKKLDKTVAGWKIAATNPEMQEALRTDRPIYGRGFAPMIMSSPATVEHANLCSPIPEVEYQAVMGSDLPSRPSPYIQEGVVDAVASLDPGIELAECRFIHDDSFPPLPVILADARVLAL